jgi:sulfoxide reductase heme-binding subunit YedZ
MAKQSLAGGVPTARALSLHPVVKPVVFVGALLPFVYLVGAVVFDQLGANPTEALVRSTGDWTLRMLCVVLAVTPLRLLTGIAALARYRRMLGLFVYFYAVLHMLSYSGFDMAFEVAGIAKDIVKRPFILVGFAAFLGLTALAITSFNRAIKMMGAKVWQRLHKAVYGVAGLALLHFFWMRAGKNDFAEVGVYAFVLAALLGSRLWHFLNKKGYLVAFLPQHGR